MCGIVGLVSREPVSSRLLEGLKRLEYRGYDSAGIATLSDGTLDLRRAKGKLKNLQELVANSPIQGNIGIGHTRWATHGVPSEENAHPHMNDDVAVVHNGIIENYAEIKERLIKGGHVFNSQTDTEVIVHLLTQYLSEGKKPLEALREALAEFKGAFALAIIFKNYNDLMLVARRGSPLVIGFADDNEMAIGSDALVLALWTQQLTYLEDGDYAVITHEGAEIYDEHHNLVKRPMRKSSLSAEAIGKGEYKHFMLKEIHEQPFVAANIVNHVVNQQDFSVKISELSGVDWTAIHRLSIVACGTSYYAGLVARYWFEKYAKLPVDVDIASEFRYRESPLDPKGAALFISQSGETIDTLTSMQLANDQHVETIALVNVPESSMARQAKHVVQLQAGPEIGVASTKAFTAQLVWLATMAIEAGRARGVLSREEEQELVHALVSLPAVLVEILRSINDIERASAALKNVHSAIFLGRGTNFPIALEGSLKLKELSYIHAEGYPSGELKHGPIALIDENIPTIVIAPHDQWLEKTLSNVQEVVARKGKVICFTDAHGADLIRASHMEATVIVMPTVHAFVAPLVHVIPQQLLAYHTALLRGTDVDQPRNLAKSVTVE